MAEQSAKVVYESETMKSEEGKSAVETTDRGLFDFMKKKEDDHMASEFQNKVHVSEAGEEHHNKHEGFVDKIRRSDSSSSSSSSSSEERGRDDEERSRRKEEKIMEKVLGHESEEKMEHHHHHHEEETSVPVEKFHEPSHPKPQEAGEKKGFVEKIKEKLPGQQRKPDEHEAPTAPAPEATEAKEKKGFLDKIKDKIPGFHSKNAAEEKKDTH